MEEKLKKKIEIEEEVEPTNTQSSEEETKKSKESERRSTKNKLQAKDEEIAKLKADVSHWKNEYFKAFADTQNLRKGLEKDFKEAFKYRTEGFIHELFPILDAFYYALQNEANSPELKNYLVGFQYVYQNLLAILEKEGVKEIAPKAGDEFDFKTMHAVEIKKGEEDNKVVQLLLKGYFLKDRLIRPANVIVSKIKVEEEVKEETPENINLEKGIKGDA